MTLASSREVLLLYRAARPGSSIARTEGAQEGPILPDRPGSEELKTVRAYGSPLRWYPGERAEGGESDVRKGSINVTVDYLPTPDDLSTVRYPTNEELETVLLLQSAMLVNKLALNTRVLRVEPNPDQDEKGDKIVTLQIGSGGESREIRLRTDGIFFAAGLGEPTYGFNLEGSRAEKVLQETANEKGFPKLSTTLEAFEALASRTKEKASPGETLVLWGRGNSADTIIEFIGNVFAGDNPRVRDVTKIYVVITSGSLSERPRYAGINDLRPRGGRGNLIEFVQARVTDVDFADGDEDPSKRKIVLFGSDGNLITDRDGEPIEADAAIAATGFRPQLDSVFEAYRGDSSFRETGEESPVKPLTLPTNPDVAVADVLKEDENVVFFGTASNPRFDLEKLAQLPKEAREALLRAGAENAVAIGFRAPDTQAAVNIWLNSRDVNLEKEDEKMRRKIRFSGDVPVGTTETIESVISDDDLEISDNISDNSLLLSPLLAYTIGNRVEAQIERGGGEADFTGEANFSLLYDESEKRFTLTVEEGDMDISQELLDEVNNACNDKDFQRYAIDALRKRRRNPKLGLTVAFKNGKMDPRNTIVEAT